MADDYSSQAAGKSEAQLSVDGVVVNPPKPLTVADVGPNKIKGQFSAVLNIHGCNLAQIEGALATSQHEVDPHPSLPGYYVRRHPIYIVATQPDGSEGEPLELNLQTIRDLYSKRYGEDMVSPNAPPEDGSHISFEE